MHWTYVSGVERGVRNISIEAQPDCCGASGADARSPEGSLDLALDAMTREIGALSRSPNSPASAAFTNSGFTVGLMP